MFPTVFTYLGEGGRWGNRSKNRFVLFDINATGDPPLGLWKINQQNEYAIMKLSTQKKVAARITMPHPIYSNNNNNNYNDNKSRHEEKEIA